MTGRGYDELRAESKTQLHKQEAEPKIFGEGMLQRIEEEYGNAACPVPFKYRVLVEKLKKRRRGFFLSTSKKEE